MVRRLKRLWLLCLGVAALGLLSAGSASAAEFHSEVAHTSITGTHGGEEIFTVNAGSIRCQETHYVGTRTVATSTTLTLTPEYTGCTAFGFVNATIDHNGCFLTFHTEAGTGAIGGRHTIECEGGKAITVTAFNCWVTIGSQSNIGPVTYTNQGAGATRDVTVDFSTSGLTYTQHSKSFPGCTNGTFTNGIHSGATTLRSFDTAGLQKGFWVH
ncbi:MAG TPA: hypothetical protein VF255_02925 [Solirubrobacterales bacterium]